MAALLSARGVHKSYGQKELSVQAIRALDLQLEESESILIMGASGCGKSTLLNLLGGLDLPDQGDVRMHGQAINRFNESKRCLWRLENLGFVYQFHHLLPEFSVLENIMLPLLIRGGTRSAARLSAQSSLEQVGLGSRFRHRPAELSGGERQRVAVARAMIGRPRLLLADEPTGNLDEDTAKRLIEVMLDQQQRVRAGLVVASHNSGLLPYFDRCLYLMHGRLQAV